LLIVLGVYWLSMWVYLPIANIHYQITMGTIYHDFLGAVLMRVVSSIPIDLVSFGGGLLCVYIIEETANQYWLISLALLYAVMTFTSFHYPHTPAVSERFFQLFESIIPSITCYLGGAIAHKISRRKGENENT
jgi:hypothetical protein